MLVTEPSCWESAAIWAAEHEWTTTLEDLVERRLMMHFSPDLSRGRLRELADVLLAQGLLMSDQRGPAVERCASRLAAHFGRQLPIDA